MPLDSALGRGRIVGSETNSGVPMSNPRADVLLYGFPRSTYVNVARLVLIAKQVPFEFHDTETEMYTDEHLERHPFGRVPAFKHGEFWLYETSAIALYVDENFSGPALQPKDARKRAL